MPKKYRRKWVNTTEKHHSKNKYPGIFLITRKHERKRKKKLTFIPDMS